MARKRTAVWTFAGCALAVAALSVVWQTSDLRHAAAAFDAQQRAAKREGVPIDWDDVRRLDPPVDSDDNAAQLYVRGFAEIHAAGYLKDVPPHFLDEIAAGKAKPEDIVSLRRALDRDARGLATVVAGTKRREYSFARPWQGGVRLNFPEFSDAREAARALVLRATIAFTPAAAAADLTAAARLGAHVGSEPVLLSPSVGASIETNVLRGVRAVGRRGGAWGQAMRPVLGALGPLPDLRHALAFESVAERQLPEDLAAQQLGAPSPYGAGYGLLLPAPLRFVNFKLVREGLESRTIEYWRRVYAELPADPLDYRQAERALRTPIPAGPSGAVVRIAAPSFRNLGSLAAEMETERRLTREALALWSGQTPFPERDPFGTGPLALRRHDSGWTLSSVGPTDRDGVARSRHNPGDRRHDLTVEG